MFFFISNETHCITALENLNTLLKNQSSSSFVNASELQEEINVWKIKLDNVQKHRRAAEVCSCRKLFFHLHVAGFLERAYVTQG